MIHTHVRSDMSVLLAPCGQLDWIRAISLRHAVAAWLRPGLDVVVDLAGIDTLDAVGISALVGSYRRVRAAGGTARITNASEEVRRHLELAGVSDLLCPPSAATPTARLGDSA